MFLKSLTAFYDRLEMELNRSGTIVSPSKTTNEQSQIVLYYMHQFLSLSTILLNSIRKSRKKCILYFENQETRNLKRFTLTVNLNHIYYHPMVPRIQWHSVFACHFNQLSRHLFKFTTTVP